MVRYPHGLQASTLRYDGEAAALDAKRTPFDTVSEVRTVRMQV
jgi:hypothetical protein